MKFLAPLLACALLWGAGCTSPSDEGSQSAASPAEGEAFLATKAKEAGVQKTSSGLLYKVLQEGTGTGPGPTDTVTVHYVGSLIDGSIFDSSRARGESISFPLNRVIPGWTEGLQLMKPGAKYELYIPYQLAYGEAGRPPKIPPYAALVFEVELLKVGSK